MEPQRASDAFVFFGATGDLAEKQIWPALVALTKARRLAMPVVAVGRRDIGKDGIVAKARESLKRAKDVDKQAFDALVDRLSYVAVDYDRASSFRGIKEAIGSAKRPLSYVALPPEVFEKVAADLAQNGLSENGKLVLEKPFGNDEASANALAKSLEASFREDQIYRIDHYLAKEQVQNIVYFRAANPVFEAVLDAEHVCHVEITMAEDFGVEDRTAFYERVGAVRDVVQNHLLSVVACLTMDLPGEHGYAALRSARTKRLESLRPLRPEDLVRGQFEGYRSAKGVDPTSTTETFAAMRLFIDDPRWKDVAFHLRTGKELARTVTEVIVHWQGTARPVLQDPTQARGNTLRFRLGPNDEVALATNMKAPGEEMTGERTELLLHRSSANTLKPYERLLGDALIGDTTLFERQGSVEAAWRVVDRALAAKTELFTYRKGSWGPREAARVAPKRGFTNPES